MGHEKPCLEAISIYAFLIIIIRVFTVMKSDFKIVISIKSGCLWKKSGKMNW